ncbi:MAG: hypothetical protein MJ177_11070 [Clostridia bacterium]|nr:hypothetical protein [Clostridia bacterium]
MSLPKKGSAAQQEKMTMNFARRSSGIDVKKLAPVLGVILVIALVFFKFGIMDRLGEKNAAYKLLNEKQSTIDELSLKLSGYDKLHEKYGRYSYGWMNEDEVNAIDRMDIMNLIEKKIMPYASISDFSISGNVITLNLFGVTLKQTSTIVKTVEKDKLVKSASVYNASAQDADKADVLMSIVLITPEDETTEPVQEGTTNE